MNGSRDVFMIPISVLIPTLNEERNLGECLAGVAWADEVVVVDSLSSDRTVAIAEAAGARVLAQACTTIEAQKNWAIPQCRHRWVLVVDADERVTPELASEIRTLAPTLGQGAAAYRIPRRTFFLGRELRYGGIIRLFDRGRGRYGDREVHGDLEVDGPVADLRHPLLHHTYRTIDDYLTKFIRYTTWAANDRWKRGHRAGWWALAAKPALRFVGMFVLQRGFLDGLAGFQYAALSAMSVFVRGAKLRAMHRARAEDARWPDGKRIIHPGAAIESEA